ncbi:hypothetical protein [Haloarcula sp. 1CSR25-25]|uniref:hypothetical protein n=1 Tax=Haloarcula sp. 1CSR25-25 TaxID=2862545 RepID=UPI0028953E21|nr:hypothetical protein [Haloarcula sp. 1CSR25-25]MDT3434684.1 hypothetical protein [Haloarcula sp. 1CSR25-25]
MAYRHGYVRHGYHRYGKGDPTYTNSHQPWYITVDSGLGANIRADGLLAETRPSPIRPGTTVSYTFSFLPQTGRGFAANEHVGRFRRARQLLVRASDVVVYGDVPGGTVRYREQHGGPDGTQLVRIGPLEATSSADAPAGEEPPGRSSMHDARWAVVSGGEAVSPQPADRTTRAMLTLEATTIAPAGEFATRTAVRAAREVNGL